MDNKGKDTELTAALAKNTLDEIPEPKSDAREITGLIKHSGRIVPSTAAIAPGED